MTNITPEMNEELCKAVGFTQGVNGGWFSPGRHLIDFCPDLTDPTNWFRWVVPAAINKFGYGHPFTINLVSGWGECGEYGVEIKCLTMGKKRLALEFHALLGHALFLAAWELLCKEEKE